MHMDRHTRTKIALLFLIALAMGASLVLRHGDMIDRQTLEAMVDGALFLALVAYAVLIFGQGPPAD